MAEMKRKASAMLEYISRTQVEMAGEKSVAVTRVLTRIHGKEVVRTGAGVSAKQTDVVGVEFAGLSTVQMMDKLTRELMLWQKEFGEK